MTTEKPIEESKPEPEEEVKAEQPEAEPAEPVTEEPVTEEPVTEEPVTEEPGRPTRLLGHGRHLPEESQRRGRPLLAHRKDPSRHRTAQEAAKRPPF
jgi:hypothetical protein